MDIKFRPSKMDIKRFLLRAVGGFIFWTVCLTPYMVFVVKTSWIQYWKWFGAQLLIVPIIAALSIPFINWFVGKFLK